jgi:tRNA-dihydrouridine synthase B
MLTVHGRTREQGYKGQAEYETIAAVKAAVRVPVVANGDITSPAKALAVLRQTGADALMVGRAAQGRPWIFGDIAHFLSTGEHRPAPLTRDVQQWLLAHLDDHYGLYGEFAGVRTARKHIGWAVRALPGGEAFRAHMNTLDSCETQVRAVQDFFDQLATDHHRLPLDPEPAIETSTDDPDGPQGAELAACHAH